MTPRALWYLLFPFLIPGEGKHRTYKASVQLETGNYCGKSGQVEILLEDLAKDLSEIGGIVGETVKQTDRPQGLGIIHPGNLGEAKGEIAKLPIEVCMIFHLKLLWFSGYQFLKKGSWGPFHLMFIPGKLVETVAEWGNTWKSAIF